MSFVFWRCRPDLNRRITVLQTGALPLGYCTKLIWYLDIISEALGFVNSFFDFSKKYFREGARALFFDAVELFVFLRLPNEIRETEVTVACNGDCYILSSISMPVSESLTLISSIGFITTVSEASLSGRRITAAGRSISVLSRYAMPPS